MQQDVTINVATKTGWSSQYTVREIITYIGSSPECDIVLSAQNGAGVAPRHAQFICIPESNQPFRFIVMGIEADQAPEGGADISPAVQSVTDGDQIEIGDFTLTFHIKARSVEPDNRPTAASDHEVGSVADENLDLLESVREESRSASIELHLFLPTTQLKPNVPIQGSITVGNLGEQSGVKFRLKVTGLHQDIYTLNSGPLLPAKTSADIVFHLNHTNKSKPEAAQYPFSIEVTAEEAYPDEKVIVSQVLDILPFYKHVMSLEVK